MSTDFVSLVVVHVLLAALFAVSVVRTLQDWLHLQREGLAIEFKRGEQSMTSLYVLYGFATVALTLAVQVSECFQGNKCTIIILDYLLLTYLFFFNSWFRNSVVMAGLERMRRI